ncbi:flap endonuclease 1 [Ignisphaera aggregans DSM 17230]|uniref:Flap endonuclease 1 n=1 Tax=Ignisphaera aggregans (strain DSM 17230 / JCM 13409 / AQ1.S1) TaxID=583356 RepID=E0SPI3_IGNAA|nr:flap endonuclease 1 [Ignisphaera aggregans DSM 17230]
MGVNLKDLITPECKLEIDDLRQLSGRIIAFDAYNALYQFLAAIRQTDGTPLMDSKGRITSHLSGLFYRTINFLENGIKPIYVFDGKPPEIKRKELEQRRIRKERAAKMAEKAYSEGNIEEASKYVVQAIFLTDEMVKEAKELLDAMGIPVIQAAEEGEAEAAYIAKKGLAWATASQDYDSLLFGAPRLVRNLTITGKRKLPGKDIYIEIKPEIIELEKLLKTLGITHEQLIDIAILIGTDYNPDGVEGIGPKTAYQLIKAYGSLEKIIKSPHGSHISEDLIKIKNYFLNPVVVDVERIEWKEPDTNRIKDLLVREHDFSIDRVENALKRLEKAYREYIKGRPSSLDQWFKYGKK